VAVEQYTMATEYTANELTITRGSSADIVYVGVYHNTNPNTKPALTDFTEVTLVQPPDPLAEGTKVDVLSLIGPKAGADLALSVPGDYQRWVRVSTATEDIIRKVDTITIL
jgi:hypothetical protein